MSLFKSTPSKRASKQPRDNLGRFCNGKSSRNKPLTFDIKGTGPKSNTPREPSYKNGGPTGRMQVVNYGHKEYYVPVDKDGFVPQEYLVQRYFNVFTGGKGIRKPMIDSSKDSKVVFDGKRYKPEEIAPWIAHPNRYDIKGIDTTGSRGNIFLYRFDRKGDVTVANAMPGQKATVEKQLKDNFTPAEIKKVAGKDGYLIVMGKPSAGSSGTYIPSRNASYVDPSAVNYAPDTLVHETIHASRCNDPSRKGVVTKGRISKDATWISGDDRNLEEAATHAETIARIKPFKTHDPAYYRLLRSDKAPNENIQSDRRLFTGDGKGLRGKAAVSSVEKNFSKSSIGDLKLNGARHTAKDYANALKNKR